MGLALTVMSAKVTDHPNGVELTISRSKNCTHCDFVSPPGMKFCGQCGHRICHICAGCQQENPNGATFCGRCGDSLYPADSAFAAASLPPVPSLKPSRQEPEKPPGFAEHRQITVVFCDLVGSTALSERLDAEDYLDLVRSYQATAAEQVRRYAGHIAQYLGDGLLIYFGFPSAHEDDASRAVHAALEIVAAIKRLNVRLQQSLGLQIALRIGVHTGSVVAGDVGSGQQIEQLAVGLVPNIAARVQSLAQPDQVLLSETTQTLVERRFALTALGPRNLPGSSQAMELFQVEAVIQNHSPSSEPNAVTFVGRQHELETLIDRFDRAAEGSGQFVFVSAEPGHGKSRLEQQLSQALGNRVANRLLCQCSAYQQNSTLYPFIELIEYMADVTPTQSQTERRRRLEDLWDSLPVGVEGGLQSLAVFLDLSTEDDLASIASDQIHERLLDTILQFLLGHAIDQPLLLTIEDLHWADESSLDLIRRLTRVVNNHQMLVVCSARSEFIPSWPRRDHHTTLYLNQLSHAESLQMVAAIDQGTLPKSIRDQIVKRADGVPLYVEEITRALVRQYRESSSTNNQIPMSLRDLLMARLDELGASKEVLQLGALLGRRFTREVLQAVSHLEPEDLSNHLQRIVGSGLLLQTNTGERASFSFRHVLVQDAAYEALLRSRRRQLHEQVIGSLRTRFPDMLSSAPEVAARHLEGAELFAQAHESYRLAAQRGAARWALAESVQNYRKALKQLPHFEDAQHRRATEIAVRTEMIGPLTAYLGYGHDDLVIEHTKLVELQRDSGDRVAEFGALVNLWGLEAARGNPTTAPDLVDEILRLAAQTNDRETRAVALWVAGSTAFFRGRLTPALNDLQSSIDQLSAGTVFGEDPADFNGYRLHASLHYAWSAAIAGDVDGACSTLTELETLSNTANEPFALAQVLCHWCVVLQDLGELPEKVLRCADSALAVAKQHDMRAWERYAHLARGWARVRMGEVDAIEEQRAAVNDYTFDENTRGHSLVMMADSYFFIGDADGALQMLERAFGFFETNLAVYYQAEALRLKAAIYGQIGKPVEALALANRAFALSTAQGAQLLALRASTTLVELGTVAPEPRWINQLSAHVQRFESDNQTPHLRRARELLARHQRMQSS